MKADRLLTLHEVQKYLRVTPTSIYIWIRAGRLPAVKVGREWRVRRSDLDAWLKAHASPASLV